jgi:hypothetical protein
MKTARVTTNGRVTPVRLWRNPAELRKKYGFYPGRKVRFWYSHSFGRNAEDGIRIIPLAAVEEIRTYAGSLGLKGKMLKSLMEEKEGEKEL